MNEGAWEIHRDGDELAQLRAIEFTTVPDAGSAEVGLMTFATIRDGRGKIADSILVEINDYALRELGVPRELVINRRATEIFGASRSIKGLIELSRNIMATGKSRCIEVCSPRNGKCFLISIHPMGPDRLVSAGIDITERRRTEAALRQSEERYRALAEELREADRNKNEFLAVLSHELRNPLASIHNSLRILDRAAPGGEQAERARVVIDRQFDQLRRLVDDLLDVTRIAQNKIHLTRRRLELNDLVRRVIADYHALCERNGLRLEFEPDQTPIFVQADEVRLAQVVANLLQNAAKFTRRGGNIRVMLAHNPLRRQAVIRVADTGEGITREMLPRLFQPFVQADSTLSRIRGGLGLGLALSKGLVELHGGEIGAHSAGQDQGAEFIVRLPLDESPAADETAAEPEAPRRQRRVLVIEDNADLAQSLRELLELDGHEVEIALNGTEGLVKACEFQPEILLCDIGLPGMDGYTVARAFRADKQLRRVFLVALSGYAQPEDLDQAAKAGFDRHLAKPPEPGALERLLAEAEESEASKAMEVR